MNKSDYIRAIECLNNAIQNANFEIDNSIMGFDLYSRICNPYKIQFAEIDTPKRTNPAAAINGLKGGRPRKYNKNKIITMYQQGISKNEIAKKLGCSWRTVHRAMEYTVRNEQDK